MIGSGAGAARRGEGFASRVTQREAAAAGGEAVGRGDATREGRPADFAAAGRVGRADGMAPARSARRKDKEQAKRLSAVASAAVAIALVAVGYGSWAVASSRSAVEEATRGAESVLVAAADVKAGDVLSASSFEVKSIPAAFRAQGALSADALSAQAGVIGGRALVDMPAGAQVTASFVTGAESGDHLAAQIAQGKEAVTLSVDAEAGIAGRVRVYDAVRIVSAEGASAGSAYLSTVCERARVVAVGDGGAEAGSGYSSVTVEVSPDEADAVRAAQYAGRVSLQLVSSLDSLGGGGDGGQSL